MVVFEKVKKIFFTSLGKTESFAVRYLNRGGQGILYVLKDSPDKICKVYWTAEETYDAALKCQTRNQNIFQEIKNRRDILPRFIPDEKLVDYLNDFYEDCHPVQSGTCYLDKESQQYPAHIMHFFSPFHELTDFFEGKEGLEISKLKFDVRLNLVLELLEIYGYYCQKKFDNKSLVHTDIFPDNILVIGDPEKEPENLHLTLIDWAGSGIWLHSERRWLEGFEPLTTGKDASAFYSYPAELEKDEKGRIDLSKFGPHTDYWFLGNLIFIMLLGEQPYFFLNNTNPSSLKVVIPEIMKSLSTKEWPPVMDDMVKIKENLSKIGIRFKPAAKNSYIQQIFETGRKDLINSFGPKALSILYNIFLEHYNDYEDRPSPTLLFDEVYKLRIKKQNFHGVELYQADYLALTALETTLKKSIPLLNQNAEINMGYQMDNARVSGLFLPNENLTKIPSEVFTLTGLKKLVLNRNKLTTISSEISRLRYLTYLDMSNNRLETISEQLGSLIHLVEINLSENNFTTLPESFKKLSELMKIDVSKNQISSIPKGFAFLENLNYLNFNQNYLEEIPEFVVNLEHLTHCDFSFNLLKEIPEKLFSQPKLEMLNLDANFLSSYSIPQNVSLPKQFSMETYETSKVPKFFVEKKLK